MGSVLNPQKRSPEAVFILAPDPPDKTRLHPRLPLPQAQNLCHRAGTQATLEIEAASDRTWELGRHPDR